AFRCCLLLCRTLQFCDPVLFVSPIERLPLQLESDSACALREEIDVLESEIADLKTQIRNVFRVLATHIQFGNLGLYPAATQLGPLFECLLASRIQIPFNKLAEREHFHCK